MVNLTMQLKEEYSFMIKIHWRKSDIRTDNSTGSRLSNNNKFACLSQGVINTVTAADVTAKHNSGQQKDGTN